MLSFLEGGGNCAELIRGADWVGHPLGPPETWSAVLKTTTSTMLASHFPQCLLWGPDGLMLYNDAYAPLMGDKPCAVGRPVGEVWSDVWGEIGPIFDRAMAGESTFFKDMELHTERHGFAEQAWFTFSYTPVRDEFGKVLGVLNTVIETTDTILAKQRIELLNGELAHRMKNTFSVVNAISMQTFGSKSGSDSPQRRFADRLAALAAAQDLLLHGSFGRVPLREAVSGTLSPHLPHKDALVLDGPPLVLVGKQVFGLVLALHELATNAVKYGAFAREGGTVTISWQGGRPRSDDPFELTWRESGVGAVAAPERAGFGTRLVTRALPMEFGGTAEIAYGEDGIVFTLRSTMKTIEG
ncbi:two-component sensor histidine kinase [Novosphingobium kunmingense]|uniref:histidine kinase n=1 Tax=Novosphingobium kunmingense TaxID=1211806 RepID=A0A2N0HJU0_9SPHN|nr:HWE histidine kinase domain-containing protein [Novosphingobium kunmingense]PKB19217.1 two-component sensor histidine kinase [Novosphingobium kunmingense]